MPCRVRVGELGVVPLSVESAAYFTVAEALTNVAKHSGAQHVEVAVDRAGPLLRVQVSDDGKGGARDGAGTGGGHRGGRGGQAPAAGLGSWC